MATLCVCVWQVGFQIFIVVIWGSQGLLFSSLTLLWDCAPNSCLIPVIAFVWGMLHPSQILQAIWNFLFRECWCKILNLLSYQPVLPSAKWAFQNLDVHVSLSYLLDWLWGFLAASQTLRYTNLTLFASFLFLAPPCIKGGYNLKLLCLHFRCIWITWNSRSA